MRSEEQREAINYLQRVIKTSKETAYDLVYQDIDIKCLEIVLDYIEELKKELEPIHELNIPVETLVAEYIRLEDLEDNEVQTREIIRDYLEEIKKDQMYYEQNNQGMSWVIAGKKIKLLKEILGEDK